MIKRVLSFLLPIKIHQKKSVYSKNLEVTWNNGHLVLDSENTNYSFGSLQRVLKKGLKYIGYERIQNFQSILVLGVAGGSVIETLKKEVKFEGKITGVEIDADVIELAKKYFERITVEFYPLFVKLQERVRKYYEEPCLRETMTFYTKG